MVRLAHISDSHISERATAATLDEQVAWLIDIGRDAHEAGAELLLHGGDVYDSSSTPAERRAAAEVIASWAQWTPVVIVKGNHDAKVDLEILARLRTTRRVYVLERPEILDTGVARVACLPWPTKAGIVAALGATSANDVHQAAAAAMRALLLGFRASFESMVSTLPRILLGHVELGSALSDSGQPLVGRCDFEIGDGDLLDVGADFYALGHIHARQTLADRLHYPGAYRAAAFGETGEKGYSLVTVERGKPPVIEFRPSKARRLVTIEAQAINQGITIPGAGPSRDEVSGAAVRLVYEVAEDCRESAARDAAAMVDDLRKDGAFSVKVDARVTTTHRVRSESIRTANTNAQRVEAWWTARGERPARAAEILAKLSEVEAEVKP